MSSISDLKKAIAAAAATVGDLETRAFMPQGIIVPCFYVGQVSWPMGERTAFRGAEELDVEAYLLVSSADDEEAQSLLDDYLSKDGTRSLRAAFGAARGAPGSLALNNTCDDFWIKTIDGYAMYAVSQTASYYGARFLFHVVRS